MGESVTENDAPGNYEDIDVADQIGGHCEYFQPDTGCIDRVAAAF